MKEHQMILDALKKTYLKSICFSCKWHDFNLKQNTIWEGGKTGEGRTANEIRLESALAMNKNSHFEQI